jgi:predicted transcriptional regulator
MKPSNLVRGFVSRRGQLELMLLGIQLALHYENLNKDQRRQIWKIFIKRLEGFENADIASNELVDTENLRDYLDELSQHNMNGRQIRNVVTTARQLAIHKKETMDFRHLNHVIKVAQKFDGYLLQVHEGTSDDQIMREDGIR